MNAFSAAVVSGGKDLRDQGSIPATMGLSLPFSPVSASERPSVTSSHAGAGEQPVLCRPRDEGLNTPDQVLPARRDHTGTQRGGQEARQGGPGGPRLGTGPIVHTDTREASSGSWGVGCSGPSHLGSQVVLMSRTTAQPAASAVPFCPWPSWSELPAPQAGWGQGQGEASWEAQLLSVPGDRHTFPAGPLPRSAAPRGVLWQDSRGTSLPTAR